MEFWLIIGIGIVAILFALFLVSNVLKRDTGTAEMLTISNAVKEGAKAFFARQII